MSNARAYTPYILEKDGLYYSFPSELSACEFLGVKKSKVSAAYARTGEIKGYRIIRAISEREIYFDKRLKSIWSSTHERCERKSHNHYRLYGGRGISVCDKWNEYLPFAKWAFSNGYAPNLTLDRIDVDGNYEPSNCRWITMDEQMSNKRNNRYIEYNGNKYTVAALSRVLNMNDSTLRERLNLGWSPEKATTQPIRLRTRGARMSKICKENKSDDD